MGRKILFITTDQQRYDSLGCNGGTIARTPVVDALAADGHQLPARVQPEHGVHAGALDDAHRPVRAHARRGRQRRAAARRRAERRRVPARAGRLPHRAARQGALRARLRPACAAGRRTAWRERGLDRPVARLRARRARRCTRPTVGKRRDRSTTARGCIEHHPEHVDGLRRRCSAPRAAATPARPRRRINPIPRELVPHRLGRRPHDRVPRLACAPTTTGSCG